MVSAPPGIVRKVIAGVNKYLVTGGAVLCCVILAGSIKILVTFKVVMM